MALQTLQDIQHAIERLPDGARVGLEKWFYSHPLRYGDLEEIDRVAQAAAVYKVDRIRMSPEQYLEFDAASPIRHEYVAGDVFAMSGPSKRHNAIAINFIVSFSQHLRGGPCRPYMAEVKTRIRVNHDEFYYYPDVMVVCGSASADSHYVEDPKLVIEVLSPSTERTDRREKALNYRQLPSLEEYVLVAQDTPEVLLHRRSGDWLPQRCNTLEEVVQFSSIGLSLTLAQIYEGVFY